MKAPAKTAAICVSIVCLAPVLILFGAPTGEIPVATGFDFPVGKPDARGYHKERGFYPNVYPAEMWSGNGGGDTDLGDPVYSIGDGKVVIAKDAEEGWGGVILIRHGYQEKDGSVRYVDSFYAHIQKILVKSGDQVKRGQQIASIGDGDGRYTAHLRLEIRKNIKIGLNTASYSKDYSNYHAPTAFITKNRRPPKP
jgi:murein DD-endopeptidase MepM/ murein hydrolase activator NlpD